MQNQNFLPLDPGHWTLPWTAVESDPISGEPQLEPALEDILNALGLTGAQLSQTRFLTTQTAPDWHPWPIELHPVELQLNAKPARLALPNYAQASQWHSASSWQTAFEQHQLLNPFVHRFLCRTDAQNAWHTIRHEEPVVGVKVLPVRSHTLPPAKHTNCFLIGDERPILVDPSPADEIAYQTLLQTISEEELHGIFLTHHHPDHHHKAPRLAAELKLPIFCSRDTAQRIPARFGEHYWQDVEVKTLEHGAELCRWQNQAVRAWAVPGHDAGHLALSPDNRAWMIVGDLIQGIGTVVIAEPEGDMQRYFESLDWVIQQAPKVIIPSHGQAMASTFRIEQTLKHRKQREQQILQMHQAGDDVEAMLAQIYAQVDKRLWGLARLNIQSHLKKLEIEQRL